MQRKPRIEWLDGLRGIGAAQVCLFHLSQELGFNGPFGPELVAFDGQLAVFIFFFISGFGLAGWANTDVPSWARLVVARAARLFIPSIAACLFAFGIWLILLPLSPQAFGLFPASGLTFSIVRKFLADMFLFMPLLGHPDSSLFVNIPWIGPLVKAHSFKIGPLWTISVEFSGSLIVLALAASKRRSSLIAVLLVSAALILTLRSLLFPFVVGFALFHARERIRFKMPVPIALAIFAYAFSMSIAASNNDNFQWIVWIANLDFLIPAQSPYSVLKCAAALLIFCTIFVSPAAMALLSKRSFRFLGNISFPLYLTHAPLIMVFRAVNSYLRALGIPEAFTGYLSLVPYALCLCAAIAIFAPIDAYSISISRAIGGRRRPERAISHGDHADLAA